MVLGTGGLRLDRDLPSAKLSSGWTSASASLRLDRDLPSARHVNDAAYRLTLGALSLGRPNSNNSEWPHLGSSVAIGGIQRGPRGTHWRGLCGFSLDVPDDSRTSTTASLVACEEC